MPQKPLLVCDLDGTLFDTKHAVIVAYGEAGVQADRVLEHWGQPWNTWCSISEHSEKVRRYRSACDDAVATPALPALTVMREWRDAGDHIAVITSASLEAASALLEREGVLDDVTVFRWSRSLSQKCEDIQRLISVDEYDVIYIDDDERVAPSMPLDASFIMYCGQNTDELREDVEWTRSFLQQART